MRMLSKHVLAVAAAAMMAGSGLLWAQPGRAPEPAQPGAEGGQPTQPTQTDEKAAQALSPQEMIADGERLVGEIQGVRGEIVSIQSKAREDEDMVRLNCLDDKLAQIDQIVLIVDAARADLATAVSAGDFEGRVHHYSLVTLARAKATAVREEADACVGEEMRFPGDSDIDVDDPGIDDPTRYAPFDLADQPLLDEAVEDPAEPIWEEDVVIERPSYATPFI
jgi:hypothetical protein